MSVTVTVFVPTCPGSISTSMVAPSAVSSNDRLCGTPMPCREATCRAGLQAREVGCRENDEDSDRCLGGDRSAE